MKISVTQKNIDEGQRGNCLRCAVSLAVLDAAAPLPEGSFVLVVPNVEGFPMISVTVAQHPGTVHFLTLPDIGDVDSVRKFIERFDLGCSVFPFEFEASVHPPFPSIQ